MRNPRGPIGSLGGRGKFVRGCCLAGQNLEWAGVADLFLELVQRVRHAVEIGSFILREVFPSGERGTLVADVHDLVDVADDPALPLLELFVLIQVFLQEFTKDADVTDAQLKLADAKPCQSLDGDRDCLGIGKRILGTHQLDASLIELPVSSRLWPAVTEARAKVVELVGPAVAAQGVGGNDPADRGGQLRPEGVPPRVRGKREHRLFDLFARPSS